MGAGRVTASRAGFACPAEGDSLDPAGSDLLTGSSRQASAWLSRGHLQVPLASSGLSPWQFPALRGFVPRWFPRETASAHPRSAAVCQCADCGEADPLQRGKPNKRGSCLSSHCNRAWHLVGSKDVGQRLYDGRRRQGPRRPLLRSVSAIEYTLTYLVKLFQLLDRRAFSTYYVLGPKPGHS